MEPEYFELGVYTFFLGLIVQSLYRIFDPVIDLVRNFVYKIRGKKVPEYKQLEVDEVDKEPRWWEGYQDYSNIETVGSLDPKGTDVDTPTALPYFTTNIKKKVKVTWKDLIGPPIIGLLIAWVFLPVTVFDYLPFQPRYPVLAYIITALMISRIANAEYDTFKTVGQFFIGIANRFNF